MAKEPKPPLTTQQNPPPEPNLGAGVEVTPALLFGLRRLQCTVEEAAAVCGVSVATMKRRIAEPDNRMAWDAGSHAGKMSLRRLQWRHASGDGSSAVQMAIHLSKHWLGEHEKFLGSNVTLEDVDRAIAELERRMGETSALAGDERIADSPAPPAVPPRGETTH